jgi:hypothetical protein
VLHVSGSRRRMCGGWTRRDFLWAGALPILGLGLDDWLRLRAATPVVRAPGSSFGRAKACILLFAYGSPPQHETFDPKPDAPAEVRGAMGAIQTRLPGIRIGDHLPAVARVLDRVTVVRSLTHPYPVHGVAYATSGIDTYTPDLELNPRDRRHWPYVGSVADWAWGQRSESIPEVPRNIVLPWKMNSRNGGIATAGPYAAFLGSAHDPVVVEFEGQASRQVEKGRPARPVADPFAGIRPGGRFRILGAEPHPDLSLDRLDRRRSLLEQFDRARAGTEERAVRHLDRHRQMALSLVAGPRVRQALDVDREPTPVREAYGMTLFGQACLTARRLVEAGGKFVTVFWDEVGPINTDWDTHYDMYHRLKGWLLPGFDRAFAALVEDLDQRGLLDETLVIWMSEHGRTPRINAQAGRDHWSRVYSIALAGGGVARGKVVGQSDRLGGEVEQTPISPKDVLATILHLLGIDPLLAVADRGGRPLRAAGEGVVCEPLFS